MNPNDKTTEYLNKLKDMKLSDSSRIRMKENLVDYARFHSVKEGVRIGQDSRSIGQVPQGTSLFGLFKQPKSMTAAIIAVVLLAGGGTSFAAEGAVPGDFLYPVKIEVNENIKSALAISNEAEARLQANLSEERLEEAEELYTRGELTAEFAADLGVRAKAHYDAAKELSAEVSAAGDQESAADVQTALKGMLETHVDVLSDVNLNVSGSNGLLDINLGADTNVESHSDTNTDSNNGTSTTDGNASSSINVDTSIDGGLDTGVTDVDVDTDASIRSKVRL